MSLKSITLFLSALLAFLLFALNAFFVWNWGDDFLIKVRFFNCTPFDFLVNDYWSFDGRSLNIGYFISRYALYTKWPWLATMIASILFFASAYLLTSLVQIYTPLKRIERFILSVFFTAILWLSSFYSLFETLYWQTGMLYIVEVFLLYAAYIYSKQNNVNAILLFVLSLLAGMASPGAVMAILFVLIIEYYFEKIDLNKRITLISFSGFLVGLLIVILSPGSISRFNSQGGFDNKAFSNIHDLYFRLHQFLDKFFIFNTPMIWLILLAGVFFIYINRYKVLLSSNSFKYIYEFRWLLAALISLLFYFPRMMYYITSPRLNIHFVFFVMLFFVSQLAQFRSLNLNIYNRISMGFQFSIFIIFIVFAFYQLWGSAFCVKKMESRIELYKLHKGKDLVLKANDLIGPPATREFIDVTEDSSYAINRAVAIYFGLKSIRKEKYR